MAAEFLFSATLHSISESSVLPNDYSPTPVGSPSKLPTSSAFIRAIRDVQRVIFRRLWLGPMWIATEMSSDKSTMPMKEINKVLEPIVQDALARSREVANKSDKIGSDVTFLEHMVSQM